MKIGTKIKISLKFDIALMLLALAFVGQNKALASSEEKLSVRYVSVSETVEKTGEERKILQALEKEKKQIESQIQKRAKKLNDRVQKIQKEATLLTESERFKKAQEVEKEEMEIKRFAEIQRLNLQKKEATLKQETIEKIKKATALVARNEKIDAVKNKDEFLWVNPDLDLTKKVIRRYKKANKK